MGSVCERVGYRRARVLCATTLGVSNVSEDGAATAPWTSVDGRLLAYDERVQDVQVICESGLHD